MKFVLFSPYLASIFFSALMAFTYRRHLHNRHLIILIPYLIYVFVQETVLGILFLLKSDLSNAVIYNIYRPVNVIVFFWIYYNLPFMVPFRKLIGWMTAIFLAVTISDYLFIESILENSSYLPYARGFMITFYALLFLFRYFQLDNTALERYWRPLLWITIGVVIYYPVVSISLSFQKYFVTYNATLYGIRLHNAIPQVMSIFMYSCFSYAFYLCKKIN